MTTPREDAIAAPPCEFVPAHEPWTCRVHNGVRTSLDEPQCDAIRPAKPLTPGQLANLYEADAHGRVPHNRYLVRGLLATIAALAPAAREDPRPAGPWTGDPADYDGDEGR